jgi:hypothetical protein
MSDLSASDPKRELLRHTLATIAYRAGKAIRNAPAGFSEFHAAAGVRTPGQILAHIGDLMDWALSIAVGKREWHDAKPLPWEKEGDRVFGALKKLDDYLASNEPVHASAERLLQGAIADALTHIGQIAMLRRMSGGPIKGESYYEAEITLGRVGAEQANPKKEF